MTLFIVAPFAVAATSGGTYAVRPRESKWLHLMLVCLCWLPLLVLAERGLDACTSLSDSRLDQYFYLSDLALGSPAFRMGRLLAAHNWLRVLATTDYLGFLLFNLAVVSACMVLGRVKDGYRALAAFLATAFTSSLGYALLPASGPGFAFAGYPFHPPNIVVPHVMHLATYANCFPSDHLTMALLCVALTWRWKWLRPLGCLHVALTVLATLGLGEHYLVDLLAAVPNAWLALWASRKAVGI